VCHRTRADVTADDHPFGRAFDGAGAAAAVEEIFEIVKALNENEGVSFLLAEQNTNIALRYAKYGYILEIRPRGDGRRGQGLRDNEDVKEFYLGVSRRKRRSFRNVKAYKRRKRWLA
jgi:branched-chain amino acid transport system ATP-binding protein